MATKFLRIGLLNVDGLQKSRLLVTSYLSEYSLDILLITESHLNSDHYIKIPNYTVYHADHPSGRARGGSAIIISNTLSHYPLENFITPGIQGTTIKLVLSSKE